MVRQTALCRLEALVVQLAQAVLEERASRLLNPCLDHVNRSLAQAHDDASRPLRRLEAVSVAGINQPLDVLWRAQARLLTLQLAQLALALARFPAGLPHDAV